MAAKYRLYVNGYFVDIVEMTSKEASRAEMDPDVVLKRI